MSKTTIPNQLHLFDPRDQTAGLEIIDKQTRGYLEQIAACIVLQSRINHCLKRLCRDLPVNYAKRYPQQDIFLCDLQLLIVDLGKTNRSMDEIGDAIDSFCSGDIAAVDDINNT